MAEHRTGAREEWRRAGVGSLELEEEHTRRADELARMRRKLPWVRVDKPYRFETDGGTKTLAELFDGRSQLLVDHFMFGPDRDAGCGGCSRVADHLDGGMLHLNQRDVTMVCLSRTSLGKISACKRRMGWRFTWVWWLNSDFNHDFGAAFTEDQRANGAESNFHWQGDPREEAHGLSSFALGDGVVDHVYSTYARGTDVFNTFYRLVDRAPTGHDEENVPPGRWRRHDEYEEE